MKRIPTVRIAKTLAAAVLAAPRPIALRRRTARAKPADSTAGLRRTIQDLEVHQTELEAQNRELRAAKAEIEEFRRRYANAYDFAPVGYVLLDRKGIIRHLNLTAAKILGADRSRLTKRPIQSFVAESDRDQFLAELRRCGDERTGTITQLHLVRRGRIPTPVQVRIEGGTVLLRLALSDINRSVEAEEAVKNARVRLEACVATRTAELAKANQSLRTEVRERRAAETSLRRKEKQLRAMTLKLSLAEEAERRRIANELHDEIGQILATSKIKLALVAKAATGRTTHRLIRETRLLLEQAIRQTRTLTFELSSAVLYELGLKAAIDEVSVRLGDEHGMKVVVESDEHPIPLSQATRVVLFRAVRELLVNVTRHAHARAVRVAIVTNAKQVEITVEDDGTGISRAALRRGFGLDTGFGLFHLQEQLAQLGGQFEIGPGANQGTRAVVSAPLTR